MKRLMFLVLALVLVSTGIMVIGCGGGGGNILDEMQNQAQQPDDEDEDEDEPQSSSDDDDSEGPPDIPVYPGADRIADVESKDNSLSKPRTIMQLIYRTGDNIEDVADFYRDKMKDEGWEELSWTEMPDGYIGAYEKGTYTAATVSITPYSDGGTAITIIAAYPD